MQSVSEIAKEIVAREGGFVNDPDDPGGATKYGVTIHTMRRLGLGPDRGRADQCARCAAVEPGAGRRDLHQPLFPPPRHRPSAGTAAGQRVRHVCQCRIGNAVKILQRLLRQMGQAADGRWRPRPARPRLRPAAAHNAAPDHLVDAYGIARRNYYFRLADRRPASRKYARSRAGGKGGWIRRAEEFISPRYHLSTAEFRKRTAAWG